MFIKRENEREKREKRGSGWLFVNLIKYFTSSVDDLSGSDEVFFIALWTLIIIRILRVWLCFSFIEKLQISWFSSLANHLTHSLLFSRWRCLYSFTQSFTHSHLNKQKVRKNLFHIFSPLFQHKFSLIIFSSKSTCGKHLFIFLISIFLKSFWNEKNDCTTCNVDVQNETEWEKNCWKHKTQYVWREMQQDTRNWEKMREFSFFRSIFPQLFLTVWNQLCENMENSKCRHQRFMREDHVVCENHILVDLSKTFNDWFSDITRKYFLLNLHKKLNLYKNRKSHAEL